MRKINRKTEAELLEELKRSADQKRGLTNTAEKLGFTIQFISDVVNQRRPVSERLAQRMGYRRVIEFEKVA
jgi:plasmid maintenance system antidote protein VapI